MLKILLLAIIVWLLYRILQRYAGSVQTQDREAAPHSTMLQCAHCGLHLPEEESLNINGKHYCCKAHSEQAEA
ncbi:MAG TPA: PP0621 family protein [Methylophilaceae bacterium]|nr:PP0621 family protein [Methylophilaceae bacterium]